MEAELQEKLYDESAGDMIILDNDHLKEQKEYDDSNGRKVVRNLKKAILYKTLALAIIVGVLWSGIVVAFVHSTMWMVIMVVILIVIYSVIAGVAINTLIRYIREISDAIANMACDFEESVYMDRNIRPVGEQLISLKNSQEIGKEEARESEKKKSDLLMFLAHDLKTPLTSVIAYLSTLDANPNINAEERKKYTHISLVKAHRLWDLIQEFFEVSQFNQQDISLEKENLNLSMMLEQMVDEMYAVFQEHDMTCKVQTDQDIMIYGDPDKLARVFDNLLRNAVNYSYPGTVIKIMAREVGEWTEIVFCNRGKTIPPENLKIIFEKFYRIDDSRSSETGGAGLGLAIAKQIVELHDGTITATSEDEETRFIVVLPEKTEAERAEKAKRLERRIEEAIKYDKIKVPGNY